MKDSPTGNESAESPDKYQSGGNSEQNKPQAEPPKVGRVTPLGK